MNRPVMERYFVSGICCSTEEVLLRKKLDALLGNGSYTFNVLTGELTVRPGGESAKVKEEVLRAGFGLRERQEISEEESGWEKYRETVAVGASLLFAILGIAAEYSSGSPVLSRSLFLAAIALGGWRVFLKAWYAARSLSLDMNFLMSIAVIGAVILDRWAEGAAVVVLFGLSLVLESLSVRRTRRAVRSLLDSTPAEATVIRSGQDTTVPTDAVLPGEVILVRPGDRIPLDGIVVSGRSTVNQAAISGEAIPVLKETGSQVYAGSLNEYGALRINVTRTGGDTMIGRIVHLVEQAQEKKAPVQMFVDRFARIYTPIVVVLALLTATIPPLIMQEEFADWFYRALVLLVIACPCALVISTPVTIVSAITRAARMGILVKGGRQLEILSRVKAIAFDKTGTLTEGKPRVTDIVPVDSLKREEVLRLAAALEIQSEHHIAAAIVAEAEAASVDYSDLEVKGFESVPGRGVRGELQGAMHYLGNHEFSELNRYCSPKVETLVNGLAAEGKTAVVLGRSGEPLAVFGMRDVARRESSSAVRKLREAGVEHMVLLSGDHSGSVGEVAREVGLTDAQGEQLPDAKLITVEDLKRRYGTVAMVGDGVNDAPALATASVGIAMGVAGTDAALESADVVLMADDIGKIPSLVELSSCAMRVIRQNIAFALAVKAVFLALSYVGVATLWMAVLADDGAAMLVILNGLRLLAFQPTE